MRGKTRAIAFLLTVLALTATRAAAWQVPNFEVYCGYAAADLDHWTAAFYSDHYGQEVDQLASPDCIDGALAEQIAEFARRSLLQFEAAGFRSPSPHRLGPVVWGKYGDPVVRLYADKRTSIMSTQAPCGSNGAVFPDRLSIVSLNPNFWFFQPAPTVLRAIAHELVHVLQNAYPIKTEPQTDRCGQDGLWFFEGTADAMSVDVATRSYPSYKPPLSVRGSKSYYGLRPYHKALTWTPETSRRESRDEYLYPIIPDYRTSSLFMYLADQYFGGEYGWLDGFLQVPDQKAGTDDWLAWFDERLAKGSQGPKLPLYLVFPDFLGNYATWGKSKYPHIGEGPWIQDSFEGCHDIQLSHAEPVRELDLELEPISGQCLSVWSDDIAAGEVVQVKLMAYAASEEEVDNLHLAVSHMSAGVLDLGGTELDCWELAKEHRGEPVCISKPYVGKKGAGAKADQGAAGWVKTWASIYQEGKGRLLDNTYVLVHTPVHPEAARHGPGQTQKARLVVGLDFPTLASTSHGQAAKATASINQNLVEPVPMESDEDPRAGLLAAAAGDPDAVSKLPFLMNNVMSGVAALPRPAMATGDGITSVTISQAELAAGSGGGELIPTLQFTVMVADNAIPFGATGTFSAFVTGSDLEATRQATGPGILETLRANPQGAAMAMISPAILNLYDDRPSATIEVLEFSDRLLRLSIQGGYCRGSDWDGKAKRCRAPQRLTAEVAKPFGWTYDTSNPFVSTDTPGMAIYRRQLSDTLRKRGLPFPEMPAMGSDAGGGDSPNPGGSSGSTGGSQPCDCSCEAFTRLRELGQETHERDAGAAPPEEMAALAQCSMTCMPEWMSCPRTR